ncbi:bifunctional oligoribonuclease/PAP phosphatase NrnA [Patescibacteria group bacterium]
MLSNVEQATRAIKEASEILIITSGDLKGDSTSSVLALYSALDKIGRKVSVVNIGKIPSNLQFLPSIEKVTRTLPNVNDFIISLDLSKALVDQLSYKVEGSKLNVMITPKGDGAFSKEDLSTNTGQPKYDLIITVGTSDLEHLGKLHEDNVELFFNTPILNIDHNPSNESYGKINIVDINASSTSQIVYDIIAELEKTNSDVIDEGVATALLTGIIAETESFQTHSTTPEVFKISSELYEKGANQQEIIRYLYKTKSLSVLNLWGRVLARLRQNEDSKIVWSLLSEDDFEKSKASHEDIESVMKELLATVPGAEILLVLYKKDKKVHGKVHAPHNIDASEVAELFDKNSGHFDLADFKTEYADLNDAEQDVTNKVKKHLTKHQ